MATTTISLEQEKISAVLSYDLKTPPGLHDKFIELMTKKGWKFIAGDPAKKMAGTTCRANFKPGFTPSLIIKEIQDDLKNVEADINRTDPTFKVERYFSVAYPTERSQIDFS
jgi:hypothetical protein